MTETKKADLFAKVRSGDVRFLLGSTAKMGAGTNVQDRLIALHQLDVPWRPSDIEQQEGRIIRQGNMYKELGKLVWQEAVPRKKSREETVRGRRV